MLVVDDDPTTRLLVRAALEPAGLQVLEAHSGLEALELARMNPIDLVVLDIVMPDMDGFETCTKLRALPEHDRLPVLILTGLDDGDSIAQAYEHGATDFATKPINPPILLHRVRYMLRASDVLTALAKSEARLELAQRIARIGNWDWEPQTGRFTVSNELCRLVGIRPQEFGGTREAFLTLVHPDDRTAVDEALNRILTERAPVDLDHRIVLPNGTDFTVNLQAEAVHDANQHRAIVIGTAQDITERKQAERAIHRLAYYDSLTGLPNRVLFRDRLEKAMAHAQRYQLTLAILFFDLDRFKVVNDTLGHTVGDMLLKQVGERLSESVRHSDSVGRSIDSDPTAALARLGGDEFTILLTNLTHVQDAGRVARRLLDCLSQPFNIDGHEIFVSVSVGIAIYPTDGGAVDTLLKNADSAMYHVKEQGRNNYQFYSASMNAAAEERLELESDLRRALEREELVVYYQPKFSIRDKRVSGAEALVRWRHPRRGLLIPGAFLSAAIDTGLIRLIDEWVLRTACLQAMAWKDIGLRPIPISVNISNSLFHGRNLLMTVTDSLAKTNLDPGCLELELTETIVMRDVETSITMLETLKKMGVRLSIDDFGTGYSSLSYLQRFPLDQLKIDQSFVKDIATNPGHAKITTAVIALAHSLNLAVLAEGVETEDQLALLSDQGCDEIQGYLLGRPMPSEEITDLLRTSDRGHSSDPDLSS